MKPSQLGVKTGHALSEGRMTRVKGGTATDEEQGTPIALPRRNALNGRDGGDKFKGTFEYMHGTMKQLCNRHMPPIAQSGSS